MTISWDMIEHVLLGVITIALVVCAKLGYELLVHLKFLLEIIKTLAEAFVGDRPMVETRRMHTPMSSTGRTARRRTEVEEVDDEARD